MKPGKRLLNVGGGSKQAPIPPHYDGWENVVLDIDATNAPDVVCDARELTRLPAAEYDAVFCCHNLEHYWRHDVPRVLAGFLHVLKPDGFAEVWVPDMEAVFREMIERNIDIDDVLYQSPAANVARLRTVVSAYFSRPDISSVPRRKGGPLSMVRRRCAA